MYSNAAQIVFYKHNEETLLINVSDKSQNVDTEHNIHIHSQNIHMFSYSIQS